MRRASGGRGQRRRSRKEDELRQEAEEFYDYDCPDSPLGASDIEAEFLEAVCNGSVNRVKTFLDCGVDPSFTVLPKRETLLHAAVRYSGPDFSASEKIVRLLLFFGCNPNATDCDGNTPLHIACRENSACHSCVLLLLEAGADVNVIDDLWRETPLLSLCASKRPTLDSVKLLVDSGADVSRLNALNENVLHLLCKLRPDVEDRDKMVTLMLERGVMACQTDFVGHTPLSNELVGLIHLFMVDLPEEKKWQLMRQSIKITTVLIAGGALIDFQGQQEELKVLTHMLAISKQCRQALLPFFYLTIRNELSMKELAILVDWIHNVSASSVDHFREKVKGSGSRIPLLTLGVRLCPWVRHMAGDLDDDDIESVCEVDLKGWDGYEFGFGHSGGSSDNSDENIDVINGHNAIDDVSRGGFNNLHIDNIDIRTNAFIQDLENVSPGKYSRLENYLRGSSLQSAQPQSLRQQCRAVVRRHLAGRVLHLAPRLASVIPRIHLNYVLSAWASHNNSSSGSVSKSSICKV